MGDPKQAIHILLSDYYQKKGLTPTIQVAHSLLKRNISDRDLNSVFNGEICETVLQIMITDFIKRNPKRTSFWRFCNNIILSDLETKSDRFLTEIDALLLTPECIYVFECKSYAGEKVIIGDGTITRKNGNNCDVYKQNSLHLKILRQWLDRFSKHPVYQMVLFNFSNGATKDERSYEAKKIMPCINEDSLFGMLHESRLEVWRPADLDIISTQFQRETDTLRRKHLEYVKSLNHGGN